jgi:protein transport protein SEC31
MGEIVYELRDGDQWNFDVQWCPRNPNLISTCSFDSRISVYSLTGGAPPTVAPSSRIAESFADPFGGYSQS